MNFLKGIFNVIKLISLIFTLVFFLLASTFLWARSTAPMLVLDMRNAPQLPKYFRTTSDPLPANINNTGLADLHIAGGAQFSKSGLSAILQRLGAGRLIVIDLRQEDHGMLNSNAVSWYGRHNAENAGKTPAQIEEEQAALLTALGKQKVALVNNVLQKSAEGEITRIKPAEYLVHQTSSEEKLVADMGQKYQRIYVQDFHAPADSEVDRFLQVVKTLPKDKWVYFHCRAGIGRTTVFMTMYDMLRNAKTVSIQDILLRQVALGGRDLTDLPEENNFKYKWSMERVEFIKKFYEYARENNDGYKTSWSEWVKVRG
jgi:hypothetical protein